MLVALLASAIFVIVATLYVKYFFEDPNEIAIASRLLPDDINSALIEIAQTASNYRLFVRTGRHFRAATLETLTNTAIANRTPIKIEAILLDFRNSEACERYASYRRSSSFDCLIWNKKYVQTQILATILKMLKAVGEHPEFVSIDLHLTSRLSTYRFDGSQSQVIITREDPRDFASRYRNSDNEYSAYLIEFQWALKDACKIEIGNVKETPIDKLREIFGDDPIVSELAEEANEVTKERSPYVR